MAEPGDALHRQLTDTLATLQTIEQTLRSTQAEVQGLPFFARGFVERDISSSTGRGFAEWIAAAARLRTALTSLQGAAAPPQMVGARQAISSEASRLAALRAYLERAPEKVQRVPAAVLKPQQRAEFLQRVAQQAQGLRALEQQLAAIIGILGPG